MCIEIGSRKLRHNLRRPRLFARERTDKNGMKINYIYSVVLSIGYCSMPDAMRSKCMLFNWWIMCHWMWKIIIFFVVVVVGINDRQNHWSGSRSVWSTTEINPIRNGIFCKKKVPLKRLSACTQKNERKFNTHTQHIWLEHQFDRHIVSKCKSDFSRNATTESDSPE